MAVMSQVRAFTGVGEALVQDWQAAGLLKPSMIKPVITTIERTLVRRMLGWLKDEDQNALKQVIRAIVG